MRKIKIKKNKEDIRWVVCAVNRSFPFTYRSYLYNARYCKFEIEDATLYDCRIKALEAALECYKSSSWARDNHKTVEIMPVKIV